MDKAVELDPGLAEAYNNRGRAYSEMKQQEQALAEYTTAIQLDPAMVVAYFNRGLVYYELKQYQQAIADFDKIIEIDPGHALAYANRGSARSALGQREQARADYEKALSLTSDAALSGKIQQALDHLGTWPNEWESGVCGAYAVVDKEVAARGSALKEACPGKGCAKAVKGFKAALGLANKAIALLKAVPSWSPGQPWVDNLLTQMIGYRDLDKLMIGSSQALVDGKGVLLPCWSLLLWRRKGRNYPPTGRR